MTARRLTLALAAGLAAGCQAVAHTPPWPPGTGLSFEPVAEAPADGVTVPVTPAARPDASGQRPAPADPTPGGATGDRAPMAVRGRVVSFGPAGEHALPGATVTLGDGSHVVTDAAGAFTIPRAPADGLYLASAPGHVTSTVAGLTGTAVTLRLPLRGGAKSAQPSPLTERPFHASGRLVDKGGAPVAGVDVVLTAADGAVGLPVTTDTDGRFLMPVFAHGRTVTGASLLALGGEGMVWIGRADGLSCSADAPALDFAARPGTDPLVVKPATHRLRVDVDAGAVSASPTTTLFLTGREGQRLAVPREADGTYAVAPGADYRLEIAAQGDGWRSVVVRDRLPLPAAEAAATVRETLLAPPAITWDTPRAPLSAVTWAAIDGALGYWLTLSQASRPGYAWEGFTTQTTLAPPAQAAGEYRLTVAALDAPGLTARSVASVPRRLVFTPGPGGYRQATRDVLVILP
jgi:hypothetical protein